MPVREFALTNMIIFETSWPFGIKFYQKYHWRAEKSIFGFGPDGIRTLCSGLHRNR